MVSSTKATEMMANSQFLGAGGISGVKVLLVIGKMDRAGTEAQILLLARGLQAKGHCVTLISLRGSGSMDAEVKEAGIQHHIFDPPKLRRARQLASYLRLTRKLKPDVIYAFLPEQHAIVTLLKPFSHQARIVWGIRFSSPALVMDTTFRRALFWLISQLSRFADLYIANSHSGAKSHIAAGYDSSKMVVVPNGIDSDRFSPDMQSRMLTRKALRCPEGVPLIGYLGRFHQIKGHDRFLRVARELVKELPEIRMVIVGRHTEKQALEYRSLAAQYGVETHIHLQNETTKVETFLNAFDVVLCLSIAEGFPNIVAESLSCGTPVISFAVGDVERIIGEPGNIVKEEDYSAIVWATLREIRNINGFDSRLQRHLEIERKFSISKMIDASETILTTTVAG
jgi:glycosyltransferase involved in cell wall biosynthesis